MIKDYLRKHIDMIRFCIVGVSSVCIHYATYLILLVLLEKNISYSIGYIISFLFNYYLSSKYTFKVELSFERFIRFAISHGINFFIYIGLFNFFIYLGVKEFFAPIPVYIIAVPISFLLVRIALFKKQFLKILKKDA